MTVNEKGRTKQFIAAGLSLVLAGTLTVGGILAYQTASNLTFRRKMTLMLGKWTASLMNVSF